MAAVFIHGVPDTAQVWDDVRKELAEVPTVALSLPGFGAPIPQGFSCSKEAYVDWIIQRLQEMDGPVDLVGHDWGCILTMRVVSLRPDLVRTWAAGAGPVDHEYVWHPLAQIWQTPVKGEEFMASLSQSRLDEVLREYGVPPQRAAEAASQLDDTMKDAILRLYRSAINVGQEWEPDLSCIGSPGAVMWGEHDRDCPVAFADKLAFHTSAQTVTKLDTGHWFILEQPSSVVVALRELWRSPQ